MGYNLLTNGGNFVFANRIILIFKAEDQGENIWILHPYHFIIRKHKFFNFFINSIVKNMFITLLVCTQNEMGGGGL